MTVPRILPALTATTRAYWTGGADGALPIERCADCRRWQHPPTGTCGDCGAAAAPVPVSGRGQAFTFSVAHQQYHHALPTPRLIDGADLVQQADLPPRQSVGAWMRGSTRLC